MYLVERTIAVAITHLLQNTLVVVGLSVIFGHLLQNTPLVAESYVLKVKYCFGARNLLAKHTILPYPNKLEIFK